MIAGEGAAMMAGASHVWDGVPCVWSDQKSLAKRVEKSPQIGRHTAESAMSSGGRPRSAAPGSTTGASFRDLVRDPESRRVDRNRGHRRTSSSMLCLDLPTPEHWPRLGQLCHHLARGAVKSLSGWPRVARIFGAP